MVGSAEGLEELYRPKMASVMLIIICHVIETTILLWRSNKITKLCRVSKWEGDPIARESVSRSVMSDFATPPTVAHQAPLSMGCSTQEYWSVQPFPSPGIFLTHGLNLGLLHCRQSLYHLSQNLPFSPNQKTKEKNLIIPTLPCNSVSKDSACSAGNPCLSPRSGRSPGEGNGKPFQYSYLENPMDRGTWQATVHGIARVGHDLAIKPPAQE